MSRTKVRNWKNLLEKRVTELIALAKELCPEAEVVVASPIGDEDAAIEVFVPSEKYDEVRHALIRKKRGHQLGRWIFHLNDGARKERLAERDTLTDSSNLKCGGDGCATTAQHRSRDAGRCS